LILQNRTGDTPSTRVSTVPNCKINLVPRLCRAWPRPTA
jgi:hypothetical protein